MGAEKDGYPDGPPPPAPTFSDPFDTDAVDRLRRRILRAVRRSCPAWLTPRVEDIAQNALTQLVARLRKSETNPGFSAMYVEKAAYGATVDEIRRYSRRRETTAEPGAMEAARSRAAGPERTARAREIGKGIVDCLKTLALPRRLAVILYLEGCGIAEIAKRRRWNHKRAQNLVYRGLADLRRCLEAKRLWP